MRFIILFVLFIGFFEIHAQKITLSGKVIDKATGESLPFSSVVIKGKPIGTIANLSGEFDFHFPSEYRNDILVVSMLGYENFEAPVWSVINSGQKTIELNKSITMLDEVVVTDSLIAGGEILRVALSKIEQNFAMEPFMMDGFYRDIKKVSGTTIALLEAAVKIFDDNYAKPRNPSKLREHVKLVEIRKSLGYENKFAAYFDQKNLLEDLLLHNSIRYHHDIAEDVFENIQREDDSFYNDHEIFVLSYEKDFKLKVFIDKVDYSIIHVDFEISYTGDNLDTRKDVVNTFIGYKKKIDFRRYNGKMYLNYITVITQEKWNDVNTKALKFDTELTQHLLINQVYANTAERIRSTEKMRNYGLQYQDYPYNKEFWASYNVIKETALDRKVIEDLEREAPLEKQFEAE
ncbi:carboxypeptidase-like regulatory domain-containing protein [Ohtaekwangia koreensis]|uniref:CarboxypepD_reg-like domain-containing protein n=1 Tax=Ohtaekwangia koreensis TaxID=688867 RepID=A0A1T5L7Y5_9BACT|nr:carboxypeptidase-like regulatory domain-containing protein [Ohtaekwangia koreensis]SKC72091.1 CarboxypepD_reg-like domain-containing protein [Ohtaekwangia koreensis]